MLFLFCAHPRGFDGICCEEGLVGGEPMEKDLADDLTDKMRAGVIQTQNMIIKNPGGDTTGPIFGPCVFDEKHNLFNMAGNIFIMGLVVLLNEILDLVASQSLKFVLQPCVGANAQNEALADTVAIDEAEIDIGGIIGF